MNTRLKQFLAAENISQSQFADTIKVVRASVSHVLAGRNKPGYDFIRAIMIAYPHLNMEWLILGKGKMYKAPADSIQNLPDELQTQPALREQDDPLLFEYDSEPDYQTTEITYEREHEHNATVVSDKQTNALNNVSQNTDKQRKSIRIAIFYDDGTYQEFQNL